MTFRRWLATLLLGAACLGAALGAACPQSCMCYYAEDSLYVCQTPDHHEIRVQAAVNSYAEIDCEGGNLTCSTLSQMDVTRDGAAATPSATVRECSLFAPLECSFAKLNVRDVAELTLRDVVTPLRKEHVEGLENITKLFIIGARAETHIPSAIFSLPNLQLFHFRDASISLHNASFPPNLQYIELSAAEIKQVPAGVFRGLGNLTKLGLWGNKIEKIEEGSFEGLTSLHMLDLSRNSLRSIPAGVFARTPQLRLISLAINPLEMLHEGAFSGLDELEELKIFDIRANLTLGAGVFSHLPALRALTLQRARIQTLPEDLFYGSTSLKDLKLTSNKISTLPALLLKDQRKLEVLDLSHNTITALPGVFFNGLRKLKELNLDGNQIMELPDQLFAGMYNLVRVSVNNNMLKKISNTAFQGATSLESLSLSSNQLSFSSSPAEYTEVEAVSPLQWLVNLKHLHLSDNNVTRVYDDWRYVLLQLETLNLTRNHFTELTSSEIRFLNIIITVDLRHNNISAIDVTDPPSFTDQTQVYSKATILLDDNPFNCDCQLYHFIERLFKIRTSNAYSSEAKLEMGDAKCSNGKLKGKLVKEVKPLDLSCELSAKDCPVGCSCEIKPITNSLDLNCTVLPEMFPSPENYGLSSTHLKLSSAPLIFGSLPSDLAVLDLSGLNLTSIPYNIPSSLISLDLTNNLLKEIPLELIKSSNTSLYLSKNPLTCDCSHKDSIVELQHIHNKDYLFEQIWHYTWRVKDYTNVTCSDGALLWRLNAARLCDAFKASVIGGSLVALGLIIAILAALLHRYALEIEVILSRFGCWRRSKDDSYDRYKTYDAFISFSHNDEKFVQEHLVPKLESENLKLCIHYRDWLVGDLIPAQIVRSVEQSRRTVIVLSQAFLNSVWCQLEFRSAHAGAMSGKSRLVVILLDPIEELYNHDKVDPELKAYLSTTTYLKWGDPLFWSKLKYAMPKPSSRKEVIKPAKLKGGLDTQLTKDGKLINAALTAPPV